jgi:hypothetical protein
MVRIKRRSADGGHFYEVEDFDNYISELKVRGIELPLAKFRVFISHENEHLISHTFGDWENQVALLFKLSPATGIEYEVVSD